MPARVSLAFPLRAPAVSAASGDHAQEGTRLAGVGSWRSITRSTEASSVGAAKRGNARPLACQSPPAGGKLRARRIAKAMKVSVAALFREADL
jgi:hypothetical protein